jgi:hypothetical protein
MHYLITNKHTHRSHFGAAASSLQLAQYLPTNMETDGTLTPPLKIQSPGGDAHNFCDYYYSRIETRWPMRRDQISSFREKDLSIRIGGGVSLVRL